MGKELKCQRCGSKEEYRVHFKLCKHCMETMSEEEIKKWRIDLGSFFNMTK